MGKIKKNFCKFVFVLLGFAILALAFVNQQAGAVTITILLLATASAAFLFAMNDSEYRTMYFLVGVGSTVSAIGNIVGFVLPAYAEVSALASSCASVFTCSVIVSGSRTHKKKQQD